MFNQSAVLTLVDNVVSHAAKLGVFSRVNSHEPKSPPGTGLSYMVWADSIEPVRGSGLAATSGYVVVLGRIYGNMLQKPEDDIDPRIMTAATTLIGEYSEDFNLGSSVRAVDLLGMYGKSLSAQAGYVSVGSATYRVMTVTIPVIVDDMWTQTA